jgi:hypothetical protein
LQTFQLITYIGTREAEVTICLGNFASLKNKYEFDETNLYNKIQHFVYRSRRPKVEGKTQIDGETEKMK